MLSLLNDLVPDDQNVDPQAAMTPVDIALPSFAAFFLSTVTSSVMQRFLACAHPSRLSVRLASDPPPTAHLIPSSEASAPSKSTGTRQWIQ